MQEIHLNHTGNDLLYKRGKLSHSCNLKGKILALNLFYNKETIF